MAVNMEDEHHHSGGNQGTAPDIMVLWGLVTELSEQLTRNRALAGTLRSQITELNASAIHTKTGFALRRFNAHLSQARFEEELGAMNNAMAKENRSLLHENKQLGLLAREYEQTLENVMSAFRTHAHDVQERELTTIREFEGTLLEQESAALMHQLEASTTISASFSKISRSLRAILRTAINGEDAIVFAETQPDAVPRPSHMEECPTQPTTVNPFASREGSQASHSRKMEGPSATEEPLSDAAQPSSPRTDSLPPAADTLAETENADPLSSLLASSTSDDVELFRHGRGDDAEAACADWALERETELARLEAENASLRDLVSIRASLEGKQGDQLLEKVRSSWALKLPNRSVPARDGRMGALGGRAGTVGPYGRYKYGMDSPGQSQNYGGYGYGYGYGGEQMLRTEDSLINS